MRVRRSAATAPPPHARSARLAGPGAAAGPRSGPARRRHGHMVMGHKHRGWWWWGGAFRNVRTWLEAGRGTEYTSYLPTCMQHAFVQHDASPSAWGVQQGVAGGGQPART